MKKIFFIFLFFILTTQSFTQAVTRISGCPYNFTKDLEFGISNKDVYILQQILNSDKRTTIASSGVGSPGMESSYFGKGTREALKRFQALFIEFVGIADGKFTGRTREMLQSVCNSKNYEPNQQVSTNNKPQDTKKENVVTPKIPLQIKLSVTEKTVSANSSIKIILSANKELKNITPDIFIVDGGTVKEVRKLSKTEYFAIIEPIEGSKKIEIQVEADKVEDIDGMTNENASNEITFSISGNTSSPNSTILGGAVDSLQSNIDKILSGITSSLPVTNPAQTTNPNPINPTTQSAQNPSGSSSSGNGGFSQMLSSLMSGFGQSIAKQQAQQNAGMDNGGTGSSGMDIGNGKAPNLNKALSEADIPSNTDPICRPKYGVDIAGSCPDIESAVAELKLTTMEACTKIHKRLSSNSVVRNLQCAKGKGAGENSQHVLGKAIDINMGNLSSAEKSTVFMVFKQHNFKGVGCYGPDRFVHLDLGAARKWGPNGSGSTWNFGKNCPSELLPIFGH